MTLRGTAQKAGKVLLINPDQEINRILEVNLAHASLDVVAAQTGAEGLGKLRGDGWDIIILDTALPDIGHYDMVRRLREASPSSRVPVIIIGARPQSNIVTRPEDSIIHFVSKPFEPREVVALVQGYLMHKERLINISPLTGLPNRIQVSKEMGRLIEQKASLAFMYIAMHDLTAVNRAYCYAQGDRIIRLLAEIVSDAVRLFGNPGDLAGHFGGDKFVVLTSPWKSRTLCRRIIADYDRRIKLLYSDEMQAALPEGKEQPPNMSIHIAVVTNQKRAFHHPLELIEAASEQIQYFKLSPESNCYFDVKDGGLDASPAVARRETAQAGKEGLKAMQGVLAWFDFVAGELGAPLDGMKDCLESLQSGGMENLNGRQRESLRALQDSYQRLDRIVEGVAGLARYEPSAGDICGDEVDVRDVLAWVARQVAELAAKRGVRTDIETTGEIGRMVRDKKSLAQSLLYIVRSEVLSSPPESRVRIQLSEKNDDTIRIKISNPDHLTSTRALNALLQRQSNTSPETSLNELYPAKVLVRGLGGELEAASDREKGTTYTVTLPKKWRSWVQDVDTLQLAMEISRKEAREALKNTQQSVASLLKQAPPELKNHYDRLSGKIQELAVLCNRSLFLADDYNTRLEIQQDRLLQQEAEQAATSEAILILCRDMAVTMQARHLFNPESAKKVV